MKYSLSTWHKSPAYEYTPIIYVYIYMLMMQQYINAPWETVDGKRLAADHSTDLALIG